MGAALIKRDPLKTAMRQKRLMQKRLRIDPASVSVTVVQHETSKAIVGVAIDRAAAERLRDRVNDGEHCELIDFVIEV